MLAHLRLYLRREAGPADRSARGDGGRRRKGADGTSWRASKANTTASCWAAKRSPKPRAPFISKSRKGFTFTPGETIDLFLPEDFPGASDDRQRSFSLASAPHEDGLTIATRMRKSAYKEPLAAAHPGAGVRIVGPTGTMSRPPPAQASEGFEKCHFA